MISNKTAKELKNSGITFKEYSDAKSVMEDAKRTIEAFEKQLALGKKFYVQQAGEFYSVGTFGGWAKNGNFLLKIEDVEPFYHIPGTHFISTGIEDVFEKKQPRMKQLHAGVE